jgi:hypothetical protein
MLQALLLALFPWLRTEKGAKAAEKLAEGYLYRLDSTQDGVELQVGDTILLYEGADVRRWQLATWQVVRLDGGKLALQRPEPGKPTRFAGAAPSWRFSEAKVDWRVRRA